MKVVCTTLSNVQEPVCIELVVPLRDEFGMLDCWFADIVNETLVVMKWNIHESSEEKQHSACTILVSIIGRKQIASVGL